MLNYQLVDAIGSARLPLGLLGLDADEGEQIAKTDIAGYKRRLPTTP
ncbi:MAG: hypothetical protein K2X93_13815 [Candidatus Obscuribacterales bacterium]|nr:hypothetical protein [Candidatus Obscuribacterales bacterium]